VANLASLFYYDAATKTLTFEGRMTGDDLAALLNLTVQVYTASGQPVVDANGNPVTKPAQFISTSVLESLYAASQDIPSDPDSGFRLGGGGSFKVTAASLDLGATAGLVSEGPAENSALANYFTSGAAITVAVAGDLNMFSTTISCLNGGNISVSAGGDIDLGSIYFTASDTVARGIFSTCDASVSVVAGGDININGSRIAAFDGGDVTVKSLAGDVDVGTGSGGSATIDEYYVNPLTREVASYSVTIPGCGILAMTFPPSYGSAFPTSQNIVGDILVEAPQGNISATGAGIIQIPLNDTSFDVGTVTLVAGTEDASGKVLYLGNIDIAGGGVIGANVSLKASGSITGNLVARDNLNLSALQNISVDAFAGGRTTVDAGDTFSGLLVSLNSVGIVGDNITASLLASDITTSGKVTSAQVGFAPITVAQAVVQSASATTAAAQTTAVLGGTSDAAGDPSRIVHGQAQLESVGRVTVLPP
jgi:hypothetical protein